MASILTQLFGKERYDGINKGFTGFLYFIVVVYIFLFLYTLLTAIFLPEYNFTLFWTPLTFPWHFIPEWILVDQILIAVGKKFFPVK